MKTWILRSPLTLGPDLDQAPMEEIGIAELVGIDETIDQDDYSGSLAVPVGVDGIAVSGELFSVILTTVQNGTGAIQTPSGVLLFFDADPNPTPGDTALTAAEWKTAVGSVDIASSDWISDANGGHCYKQIAVPFHSVENLYAVWKHTDATSLNSDGGDDEELHCNFWCMRHS